MRIGIGYDIHRLEKGLKLTVGGMIIPYELGLKGHSDADVLLHAICDALLGAASLGDIGKHFPDKNHLYEDISSIKLLKKSYEMVCNKGLLLENLDATIFAEKPNFSLYKTKMEKNIANTMAVNVDRINIKATTTERLGVIGNCKGIAAMCVALLLWRR